jgi:transposase
MLHAIVHAADIQDRDGGLMVMATPFGLYPFLLKLYADGGYQGPQFRQAMCDIMGQINVEIVKRSDQAKGFIILPKRWVVERTLAWLGRCRRLAKGLALLANSGPVVLTDFGSSPVPQPTVARLDRGTWRGLESQSGFVRAASSGA